MLSFTHLNICINSVSISSNGYYGDLALCVEILALKEHFTDLIIGICGATNMMTCKRRANL